MRCLRILTALAFASLHISLVSELRAQDYPAKPIRLIVSFPGGTSDVLGRAFAQQRLLTNAPREIGRSELDLLFRGAMRYW